MPTYTLAQVGEHNKPDDVWFVVHNKVYNVTNYLEEHPGGGAILLDVAGRDATHEFEDIGHSEEANDWLESLYIGDLPEEELAEEIEVYRPKFEQVSRETEIVSSRSGSTLVKLGKVGLTGAVGAAAWILLQNKAPHIDWNSLFRHLKMPDAHINGNLWWGVAIATAVQGSASLGIAAFLYSKLDIHSGLARYKPRRAARSDRYVVVRRTPHCQALSVVPAVSKSSVLDAKQYRPFKLVRKSQVAPGVYRFIFALPHAKSVLGLPTGQHIALQAAIGGKTIARSYTPISNNSDLGRIELLVKVYQQGLMTQYLANMQVGEMIDIRGPKGSMQYSPTYANRIGMIAGGSGITPMFQLIRAICEDESDNTKINLVYANNTEEDILLREELDAFVLQCPEKFSVRYVLAKPPHGWAGESGFVSREMIAKYLPEAAGDSKVLLCGPPPMIEATKRNLVALGFQAPGAVSKAGDQVFLF